MLLKLLLPRIDQTIATAAVVRWYKSPGEKVGFGDRLLDFEVQTVRRSRVGDDARKILGFRRRKSQSGAPASWLMDVSILVRVTSSDFGIMKKACADVGDVLEPGALLALFSTDEGDEAGEASADAIAAASELRATANYLELS